LRIIISPAKKMKVDTDSFAWRDLPCFLNKTEQLLDCLRSMDYCQLKQLWKCNDNIAALNEKRVSSMNLRRGLTPAILAYEGIQYQYMAPTVFTEAEYGYIQEHLRILSGFYGILRPFDGVTPYRLEMQAKLETYCGKDLYSFWGDSLANQLFDETDCILNLASKEYSQCISRFLEPKTNMITCMFCEEKGGKLIEKGTMCKMARGDMVRYMAEQQIDNVTDIRCYNRMQYHFSEAHSDTFTYVFLRQIQ